jgi:WD40 repeat protein
MNMNVRFASRVGQNHRDPSPFGLPKGNLLASCGSDETVRIWDTQTHKLLATLEGHKKLVRLVRFSADGKTLTSVDDEGVVKVWETK